MSSLRRGHANLLCIVPILVYVLPKRALVILFLKKNIYVLFGCSGPFIAVGGFSLVAARGLLFIVVPRFFIAVTSLVAEHGL